jgi:hypothetical protein
VEHPTWTLLMVSTGFALVTSVLSLTVRSLRYLDRLSG